MVVSALASKFFVCKTPLLTNRGMFSHVTCALFMDPENTRRVSERSAALARAGNFVRVYPPFPIYRVEVFSGLAEVSRRIAGTVLPLEAKNIGLLRKELGLRWFDAKAAVTHITCFDPHIWTGIKQMDVSELAGYLPRLNDPWYYGESRNILLSFVQEGRVYWNAPAENPELYRSHLAEFTR